MNQIKFMIVIPRFSDIRPVTLLGPIYGLFFGVHGCIVFAFLNLIMDIASNSLRWSSMAGLAANFLWPFLILVFWKRMQTKNLELHLIRLNINTYFLTKRSTPSFSSGERFVI